MLRTEPKKSSQAEWSSKIFCGITFVIGLDLIFALSNLTVYYFMVIAEYSTYFIGVQNFLSRLLEVNVRSVSGQLITAWTIIVSDAWKSAIL